MSDDRLPPFDSEGSPPPPPPPPPPSGSGGAGAWAPPPVAPEGDQEGIERPPSRRSPAAPFSTDPAPIPEPLPEPPPPAYGGQRAGLFDAMPREEAEPAPSPFSASAAQPAAPSPPPTQPPPPDIGQNLGPAPGGPFFHDPPVDGEDGGGRPQWLLPVIALVVLLLVGAAFLVVQGLGDDDAESPDETAQTDPTDPTTASTDTTPPPSTEAPSTSAVPGETTTTTSAVPAEVRVAGVVHLRDQVPGPSADAAACEALAGATEVRVSDQGGELVASAPLTSTAQLDARPEGGSTTVTCELRYEVGLPAGSTTPFTFSLVSSAGELHDLRIVPADQLSSGTGPFLGTVFVPA